MRRFRIGLRTLKTALAVTVSLLIASLLGDLSIFPALSAFAVMARTFEEGLQECRNQAVGIAIGGFLGCMTVLIHPHPPIWVISLGVMAIIVLCTSLRVTYSCGLSVAIFVVSCMTAQDQVIASTLTRLIHTAIGLLVGLAVNYLIVPYDNSKKIYELFQAQIDLLPKLLNQSLIQGIYPDLKPVDELMDRLQYEMTIYHHQRFRHKNRQRDEHTYMSGCLQLAERIRQELHCLRGMDTVGVPNEEHICQLRCIGLTVPEYGLIFRHSTEEENTVANYHLEKLLEARKFLVKMLEE